MFIFIGATRSIVNSRISHDRRAIGDRAIEVRLYVHIKREKKYVYFYWGNSPHSEQ